MGATLVNERIFDGFMIAPRNAPELMHGYTYSAHPLACAAGLATLDAYQQEGMFAAASRIATPFAAALLALQSAPQVADVRCCGLLGAVDLAPREGAPGARGAEVAERCLADGVLIRAAGDTLVLSPPLVVTEAQIGETVAAIRRALASLA
jgi:beta-alanine--pyruvate transaminase